MLFIFWKSFLRFVLTKITKCNTNPGYVFHAFKIVTDEKIFLL